MSLTAGKAILLSSAAGGGYEISRSLRFNSSDSAYLSRTPASAGNRKTWTWAGWVKRSGFAAFNSLFGSYDGSTGSTYFSLIFTTSDTLRVEDISTVYRETTQVFRDPSAWYHVVLAVDTTAGTASNRVRLYVNGVEVTAFNTSNNPTPSADLGVNGTYAHGIGRPGAQAAYYFNGYLADIHFIDGQALTPSSFTEVSATTGQLIPKAYTGSFGTNGFHLDFADNSTAAALGTDTSGNGNTWTVNNLIAGPPTTSNSWSGYFNGSSATPMYVGDNNAFTFDSDFTVEAWVKPTSTSAFQIITSKWDVGGQEWLLAVGSGGTAEFYWAPYSAGGPAIQSSAGAIASGVWSHIAAVRSSGTITLYVNGISVGTRVEGSAGTNQSTLVTVGYLQYLGGDKLTGYISNLRIVKGTAVYTGSFTVPTSPLTAVTNTSLLTLQDSTFIDNSTNGFAITTNGVTISLDSPFEESVDTDSLVDTPTSYGTDTGAGGEVRGNYCTWNPLNTATYTFTNGNLEATGYAGTSQMVSTIGVSSGKWYCEISLSGSGGTSNAGIGISKGEQGTYPGELSTSYGYFGSGVKINAGSATSYGATYTYGDIIGIALDMDAGTCTMYKNGSSQGQLASGLSGTYFIAVRNSSSAGDKTIANFGARSFAYTAPSGFKALCDTNLPAPVVAKPSTVMDVALWTGDGNDNRVITTNFSPEFLWLKRRDTSSAHRLADVVRGDGKILYSDFTDAETTETTTIKSLGSTGFTLGTSAGVNASGGSYVGWHWDAGTTTVTNTQGSITSQVRANASAGFSIVTYTGTGANATVGHGLGIAPGMIIIKDRDFAYNWQVYHQSLLNTQALLLNTTAAAGVYGSWNSTSATSSVFSLGSASGVNEAGRKHVAYCFAPVAGYSSFGSYTGNGSTDGPFVFCGFRPRWIMWKRTDSANIWFIYDAARDTYNVMTKYLVPNASDAEATYSNAVDYLSNGFKVRNTADSYNASGGNYIYAAFAESPFQYARAR